MKLVVLESPYAGDVEKNVEYARRAMKDCINRGEAPIASHLLYTQEGILNDNNSAERQLGIFMGYFWGRNAHAAVFYTDLGITQGMLEARKVYEREGLKIEYRTIG